MNSQKTYACVVKSMIPVTIIKATKEIQETKPTVKSFCQCCGKEVSRTTWYEACRLNMCTECINFLEYNGFV
jgi:hypothetical protein